MRQSPPTLDAMTSGDQMRGPLGTNDGFALVAVIWIVILLSAAALLVTTSVRSHIRSVEAQISSAEAETAADTGVAIAIQSLATRVDAASTLPLVIARTTCRVNSRTSVGVSLRDAAGQVDLNIGSPELIRALMTGLGWPQQTIEARIDALLDFIDADDEPRVNGAEVQAYQNAGRATGPRNAPFAAIEELGQVIGFDDVALAQLAPHVTVHSGQTGVDPRATSPRLTALLESGANGDALDPLRRPTGAARVPDQLQSASTYSATVIIAHGATANGADFLREAVVKFRDGTSRSRAQPMYRIVRWARSAADDEDQVPNKKLELPAC